MTHHPLLLRGVHGVGADTPKGALVHRLIRHVRRCSPRTPTPTPPTPASPTRWPPRSAWRWRARWNRSRRPARQDRHVHPGRPGDHGGARRAGRRGGGGDRRLQPLLVRHRGHRPVRRWPARTRRSARSGSWSGWRRRGWRWCCRAAAAAVVAALRGAPLRGARLRRPRARRPAVGARAGPDRHPARARAAARLRRPCRRRLPPTAWGCGRGRPDRPIRRVAVRVLGLRAGRGRRGRRRRLRHRGPAAPPGVGEPGGGRSGAGRRRPLGVGVALVRAGGRRPARGAGR